MRSTGYKQVLAYTTVKALGVLTMLIGIGTEIALTAALAYLLAHSLYKGGLFMVAGIVDHEAGAKDLLQVRGLDIDDLEAQRVDLVLVAELFSRRPLRGDVRGGGAWPDGIDRSLQPLPRLLVEIPLLLRRAGDREGAVEDLERPGPQRAVEPGGADSPSKNRRAPAPMASVNVTPSVQARMSRSWQHLASISGEDVSARRQLPRTNECAKCQ